MRFELRSGRSGFYFYDTDIGEELSLLTVRDILNKADSAGIVEKTHGSEMTVGQLTLFLRQAQRELGCQAARILMHPKEFEQFERSCESLPDCLAAVKQGKFHGVDLMFSFAVPVGFVRFLGENQRELQLPPIGNGVCFISC